MNFSLSGGSQDKQPAMSKDKKAVEKQKKDWFDWWLSDDPPAPAAKEELRANRVKQANTYKPRNVKPANKADDGDMPAPTNVTININLSKLKVPRIKPSKLKLTPPKVKLPGLPYRRIAIVGVGIVVIVVPATLVYKHHQKQVQTAKVEAARQALAAVPARTSPSFTPVVPKDKPELSQLSPDNKKTAYDGSRDTLSYIDNFDANNLTVSQQPLPAGSGTAQQIVAKVANQISAKTPILLNGNNAAYLHDEKGGAQTIVFSINGLLIFINSPFHHDAASYKVYIENLQ